ncbi:MAG: hypothetical protein IKF29_00505 [Oceanobacillus sp.]|nr:hypothetical protein [Oceanobacillus sp.]
MENFQSYMHGYITSQIKYWEERRKGKEDPVLVALYIGRIQAYYDVLKEMEEIQNIAEYCRNDVIATGQIADKIDAINDAYTNKEEN